jgi:hypothetical protein
MSSHDDGTDRTTDLLRQALTEEAAMVEPGPGGLQQIQSRTADDEAASRRTRRRWLIVTPLGAGLAAAAVITGIVLANGGTNTGAQNQHAINQPGYTTPDPHRGVYDPSAPASEQVTVYYPGKHWNPTADPPQFVRLYAETHTVANAGDDPQLAAVNELLRGTPIDSDYRSLLPQGLYATGVTVSGGVTSVDLAGDYTKTEIGINPHPSPLGFSQNEGVALQGLLKTVGATGDVTFTYNGEPIDMLENNDVSPLSPASDDETRAFVTIDNIVDGQTVASPVTVQVSGNVFEGNVTWTLLDASGTKVDEGYVTTSMGMWTQAPVELGTLDPGTYIFRAFELSAMDGSVINLDDKTFTVE